MKLTTILPLALIMITGSPVLLHGQDNPKIVPRPNRFPADNLRTGDTLDGIHYYLKLVPGDTTRRDRMPVVGPPEYGIAESQPVPLKQVQPVYPEEAFKSGLKGTVWVKCLIGTDGKVKKTEVMKADSVIFIKPAIEAAKQWIFTPARLRGKPVETWAAIPFRFDKTR